MAQETNFFSGESQTYWACKQLVQGRTITQKDHIREAGGWRLPAIVHALIHDHNWPIDNATRGTSKPGRYSLPKDCDPLKLDYPPSAKHLLRELQAKAQSENSGGLDG